MNNTKLSARQIKYEAQHLVHHLGLTGGTPAGNFTTHLMNAFGVADPSNRTKLALGFPEMAYCYDVLHDRNGGEAALQQLAQGGATAPTAQQSGTDEDISMYFTVTKNGVRRWFATDENHALEQHNDAGLDEEVIGVHEGYRQPQGLDPRDVGTAKALRAQWDVDAIAEANNWTASQWENYFDAFEEGDHDSPIEECTMLRDPQNNSAISLRCLCGWKASSMFIGENTLEKANRRHARHLVAMLAGEEPIVNGPLPISTALRLYEYFVLAGTGTMRVAEAVDEKDAREQHIDKYPEEAIMCVYSSHETPIHMHPFEFTQALRLGAQWDIEAAAKENAWSTEAYETALKARRLYQESHQALRSYEENGTVQPRHGKEALRHRARPTPVPISKSPRGRTERRRSTMTSSRFDPMAETPYATCNACGVNLATEQVAVDHRAAAGDLSAKSEGVYHPIQVINPPRELVISNHVKGLQFQAIQNFLGDLEKLVDANDVTSAEIAEALRSTRSLPIGAMWADMIRERP